MGTLYIILEYLLIENFIINFLILYLTKIIIRDQGKLRRLILGGIFASIYSLAYFLPFKTYLLSSVGKIIISLLIVMVSFSFVNMKIFIKTTIAFFITSFIFAGGVIGTLFINLGNYFSKDINLSLEHFPVKILIIGILLSFLGSRIIFRYFNIRVIRENYIADVVIHYKNQKINIEALLDTGNSLVEPITKKKVMVVDYKILKDVLPDGLKDFIDANEKGDYLKMEEQLDLLKDEFIPRFIPYKSVGKGSTIVGFKPDYIEINYKNKKIISDDVIIGLYSGSLTNDMGYSGLLNFEIIWGDLNEVHEISG